MMSDKDGRLAEALRHLHPPAGVKLWHGGATVLGSIRGVDAETASWVPGANRHSIWALCLHIAYWKYAVTRRLTDGVRGSFPRSPSDWPAVPVPASREAWKADRSLLRETHDRLVEAVESFDPERLDEIAGGEGKSTYADLIWGIVLHDTYHVAQIQLLKRLKRTTV
jgi:uncharacterized damage-inducible protein DinB